MQFLFDSLLSWLFVGAGKLVSFLSEILTEVTFVYVPDVTVDGIANSKYLWFYNILGLFRVSFEYLSIDFQSYCLQHLTVSMTCLN